MKTSYRIAPVALITIFTLFLFASPASAESSSAIIRTIIGVKLSLTVSAPQINFNFNATNQNNFLTNALDLTVSTNSHSGYTLTMVNQDEQNALISSDHSNVVASISVNNVKSTDFPANSWGYSLDQTNFHPIPSLTAINLASIFTPTNNNVTRLTFGAKVDETMLGGSYSDTLVFSAVANPSQVPTFNGITSLQDMTPDICAEETTPLPTATETTLEYNVDPNKVPEAELTDTRDGKSYIVRKLADGRCWMSQNLNLDLNNTITLTNQNTDLNSKDSWTPQNNTQVTTGSPWGTSVQEAALADHSYSFGDIYFSGTGASNQTFSDSGPKTAHAGNLYNWYAATAGSGTLGMTTPGERVTDSICPKGWKLPYGNYRERRSNVGDFRTLFNTHGITHDHIDTTDDIKLLSRPLNYIRPGMFIPNTGLTRNVGEYGTYWTSSVCGSGTAHIAVNSYAFTGAQEYDLMGSGHSIRCMARY